MKAVRSFSPYLVFVVIAPFLLLAPALVPGKAMFWGTVSLQFLPWRVLAYETLRLGQFPLWNPLLGMGAPLAANYQSALFYPPNWLVLLSGWVGGAGWAAWGQTFLVAAHLAWAGVGMAFLVRMLGMGSLAQAVCGLAYALSGYLVARSGFLSINAAAAWVPWVIWGVTDLVMQRVSTRRVIKLSLFLCFQFLCGHAQVTWYTLLLAFIWSGVLTTWIAHSHSGKHNHAYNDDGGMRSRLIWLVKTWTGLALSYGLGAILASIQLIPTAELFWQSQRASAVDFNYAMTYSFWPWRFLTLFAPNLFGSPVSNNYWGYGNYWEDALYIGLLPLILAILVSIAAIWHTIRRKKSNQITGTTSRLWLNEQRLVVFLLALILCSFLLALGNHTPVYPWLYRNIPTFALFQAPTRFSLWAEFSLVLLAGIGVSRWRRPVGRGLYWTRLATAGAGAVSIGTVLAWYLLGEISPTFINAAAVMGLVGVGVGVLSLAAPTQECPDNLLSNRNNVWAWAVMLLLSVDLLLANWGLNPGIAQTFYTDQSESAAEVNELRSGGRLYLSAEDEYSLKYDRFMRFDAYSISERWQNLRAVMLPNLSILDGIPSVNNFDPLLPGRYSTWMETLNQMKNVPGTSAYLRMLDLMDVGVVEKLDPSQVTGVSFQPVLHGNRLRWVECAQYVSTAGQAWDSLISGDVDFQKWVVLEMPKSTDEEVCLQSPASTSINLLRYSPNQIVILVESPLTGWLVLSDVWYPGWQAEVDGRKVPVIKADYLFRAVQVPSGMHQIVFYYCPFSFYLGLSISLAAWVGCGLWWLFHERKRKVATPK